MAQAYTALAPYAIITNYNQADYDNMGYILDLAGNEKRSYKLQRLQVDRLGKRKR